LTIFLEAIDGILVNLYLIVGQLFADIEITGQTNTADIARVVLDFFDGLCTIFHMEDVSSDISHIQ
jgi:hypothetical protein